MRARRRARAALTIAAVATGAAVTALATPVLASTGPAADPYASVAYQHDPAHDGHSTDPSFVAPLVRAWSTTLGGTVGYPLIADGRVFVSVAHELGRGNDVEALSLSTGEVLWGPTSIDGTYSTGSLAYDGGRLFALNNDGELTAFDATTGIRDWVSRVSAQESFNSPPTAVNGTVYLAGAGVGGTLFAVDETEGTTTWSARVDGGENSSPTVDPTGVYVSYTCEQTYRFGLGGSQIWHNNTDCDGGGGTTAVLHDGKLYVRDFVGPDPPAVLDAATGAQLGTFTSDVEPAFDERHMATVSNGVLTISDLATGHALWHSTTGDNVSAPLIANGYVLEEQRHGAIEARYIQDGQLAWRGQAGADPTAPDEHNYWTLTGLAEGDGALAVPAGSTLTVFGPSMTTVAITHGPDPATPTGRTATFAFSSGAPDAHYTCALDDATAPCTSPVTYTDLEAGRHDFSVTVVGSTTGIATRTFEVDVVAPGVELAPFRAPVVDTPRAVAHWSAHDDLSGVRASQLRVRRATLGEPLGPWHTRSTTAGRSASLYLPRDSRLCVSVRAEDGVGNRSDWSTSQCVRRPATRR